MNRIQDNIIDLSGLNALITGGAIGIGREIAHEFSACGVGVAICDLDDAEGSSVAEEINQKDGKSLFIKTDVTDEESVIHSIAKALDTFGHIDIVVTCAGITRATPLEEIDAEEWDTVLAINLKGPFLYIKHIAKHMKSRNYGRIILFSSIAAIAGGGFVGTAHYAASKAGISALTKAAAKHLGPHGITVNAVAPGPVRTRMSMSWIPTREKEVASTIPVRRIGEPEDIAHMVLYLASRSTGLVTGQTLIIDGGVTIAASKNIV